MFNKPFFLLIFLLIIIQVSFSFYYSSEIITQNNLINQNHLILEDLKIQKQDLEINLSKLTSLTSLETPINQRGYINLIKEINLVN